MNRNVYITFSIAIGFICGVLFAQTDSFNKLFYIKKTKMSNLTTKTLDRNTKALYKAKSQADITITSTNRYESYHEYYLNIVDRIKKLELQEPEKSRLLAYINGYNDRKQKMFNIMYPKIDKSDNGYGTMSGSSYSNALVDFDRIELLAYRTILYNIYSFTHGELIEQIFAE